MGSVARDGENRSHVFDFTLEGVAGAIATAASPAAGVDPHRMVLGKGFFDQGEGVEVAVGAVDEHEWRSVAAAAGGQLGAVSGPDCHHHRKVRSTSWPTSTAPARVNVSGLTTKCWVTAWTSRSRRCRGLLEYKAVPPPAA